MIKRKEKYGFSLVEIMLSVLILTILALGGASVLYRTGAGVQVEGVNRVASEMVNGFLEEQKAWVLDFDNYLQLSGFSTNLVLDDGTSYPIDVVVSNVVVAVYEAGEINYIVQKDITVSTVFRDQTMQVSSTVIPPIGIQE